MNKKRNETKRREKYFQFTTYYYCMHDLTVLMGNIGSALRSFYRKEAKKKEEMKSNEIYGKVMTREAVK